jgi:hypothetical protein
MTVMAAFCSATAGFDWPDLLDKRLIVFSEAPTPWYVRTHDDQGLDPDRVEAAAGLPPERRGGVSAR